MKPEDIAAAIGIKPHDSTVADAGRAILAELDALADSPTAFRRQLHAVAGDADTVAKLATLRRLDLEEWTGFEMRARAVPRCMRDVATLAKLVSKRCEEQVERLAPPVRVAEPGEREVYDGPECVPDGWAAPVGWRVTPSGVFREHADELDRVATRPVWVVGYLRDVDGHGYAIRLAWMQIEGHVEERVVASVSCADSRGLVALATYGFPVTSANARSLAIYIDAALEANRTRLPIERVAHRMGWLPGGGFLLGGDYIGPEAGRTMLAPDPGLDQLASAYRTRGTWQGWLDEVVLPARASPMLWLSIYNAVASVLIEPFDLGDNWSLDRSGETSRGKSTVGRAACSVWSDPRQRMSWKTTPVGIEATASLLRNLPLSLDDTKKARKPQDVAAVVYMHSGGTGKLRGKPGEAGRGTGLRTTERWFSALDSDGEQSLTSFTQDAGARARVLVMKGDPLPDGATALQVGLGCEAHYGHLGRRVLDWLANPDNRAQVEAWWAVFRPMWRDELAVAGPVGQRLSRIIAALQLAKRVSEAVGLPVASCDPLSYARACACEGNVEADLPADALRAVYDVAASRPTHLFGRHETDQHDCAKVPPQGWLGLWSKRDNWTHLNMRTAAVRKILKAEGFDPGILDRWTERGWLEPAPSMGNRAKLVLDGAYVNVYRIKRSAIDEVVG
jgi:hypothetical protein